MPRPVCVACQCEFRVEKNDTLLIEMAGSAPYQLWNGDTWRCPGCGVEVVIGFGASPLVRAHQSGFQATIAAYRQPGRRIEYDYEAPTPKET